MQDHSNAVMIALIPVDKSWCKQPDAHMTLVYCGHMGEIEPTTYNEIGKDAFSLGINFGPQTLDVMAVETLGQGTAHEPYVEAFTLKPTPDLMAMRAAVEMWNASEHPFKPHVTIGPMGSFVGDMPASITFDQVMFAWGSNTFTTRLNP